MSLNRKASLMSLRHRVFGSTPATSFARKLSGPVDRGWGDTFIGPLDALRERELLAPAKPAGAVPPASNGAGPLPRRRGTGSR